MRATEGLSSVTGIRLKRDSDDVEFTRFFKIVQDTAAKMGKVYFLDCGENHDGAVDGIQCEETSGWLIDKNDVGKFEPIWRDDPSNVPDQFDDDMCMADWEDRDGKVSIVFRTS